MNLSGTQGEELPIPMHAAAASPYGRNNVLQLHNEHGNNNGQHESPPLPPPPAAAMEEGRSSGMKRAAAAEVAGTGGGSAVKYRECLKNHAAAMGGNATDGCGEFMPSGDEGSLEALKCSACGCHRNFHRKEVDDDDIDDADGCAGHGYSYGHRLIAPAMPPHHKKGGGSGLLVTADHPYGAYAAAMRAAVPPPPPPGHLLHHHQFVNAMPLSVMHTSESDEMDGGRGSGSSSSKKRFRTKFTAEQKARMLDFAERVGWRLQRLDDGMVQAFCQEIGVKRRVLKVWMHNNKHNLATKRLEAPPPEAPMPSSMASPPPPPQMPMVPPPPSSLQPGPSFRHGGPSSSPSPQMPMPMVPPPPPFHRCPISPPPRTFHRGPGSPPPLKLD